MPRIPSATTSDFALAAFAMIETLYRELVASGRMTQQDASQLLSDAALRAAAVPHGDGASELIRSVPLARHWNRPA